MSPEQVDSSNSSKSTSLPPFHYSLLYLHPLWCSRHLNFHIHFFLHCFFIFLLLFLSSRHSASFLIIIITLVIFLITYTFFHIVRESVIYASKLFFLVIISTFVIFFPHTAFSVSTGVVPYRHPISFFCLYFHYCHFYHQTNQPLSQKGKCHLGITVLFFVDIFTIVIFLSLASSSISSGEV